MVDGSGFANPLGKSPRQTKSPGRRNLAHLAVKDETSAVFTR